MQIFNVWILIRPLKPAYIEIAHTSIITASCSASQLLWNWNLKLPRRPYCVFLLILFFFIISLPFLSIYLVIFFLLKTAQTMIYTVSIYSHSSSNIILHAIRERVRSNSMLHLSWFGTHFMVRKIEHQTPCLIFESFSHSFVYLFLRR